MSVSRLILNRKQHPVMLNTEYHMRYHTQHFVTLFLKTHGQRSVLNITNVTVLPLGTRTPPSGDWIPTSEFVKGPTKFATSPACWIAPRAVRESTPIMLGTVTGACSGGMGSTEIVYFNSKS